MQTESPEYGHTIHTAQQEAIELSVIIPTRNEAGNIKPLLDGLAGALAGIVGEVLFVDDSTDSTAEVIRHHCQDYPYPITVIARPPAMRNGLSSAVVEGLVAARGTWACVMDADLQHPPEMIPRLLNQAKRSGADLVVASRRADFLGPVGLNRLRALTSQLLTILARVVFPRVLKNVSDPLTGFFLIRRSTVDTAILQPEGFKILLEILARHPDLRVTELHFVFAHRQEGQSKADLNEGMRFFRHLIRLRLTVNQHLIRFLVVLAMAILLNLSLLGWLFYGLSWNNLQAAAASGFLTLLAILFGEAWIFSDRPRGQTKPRLWAVLLLGLVFLIAIYVPIIYLLITRLGTPILIANSLALLLAGFVYYLFSEQWIWTRGLMMRPRASTYYDIHGILTIASQIPLDDLAYFRMTNPPTMSDMQIRIDRHGTPSRVPGAICYDEHLGRFGFGLTILPGDFTEVVVSPLMETSPDFLYTNIVEPVIRWMLVTRGYSLARTAALRISGPDKSIERALLIAGQPNMSYGLIRLCKLHGLSFMGDDRIIMGRDRLVRSFPKQVTISHDMLSESENSLRQSLILGLQRWLYSQPVRRFGLFFSQHQLPAATVNTYLQRIIPQPKFQLQGMADSIPFADLAHPSTFLYLGKNSGDVESFQQDQAIDILSSDNITSGFQPYPSILRELNHWGDRNWLEEERSILREALSGIHLEQWESGTDRWWEQMPQIIERLFSVDLAVN
ncbi:MAG: glycosyltransferase [Chloroflexota bacterium]|jgi:dolichol-phosphate mannosyltransferase